MTDTLTKKQRSYCMSHIKGSRTRPELELKKTMKIQGFSYQPKGVYGNPDFASKKHKIAVFIDGCFWHGCPRHYKKPKSNHDYWKTKITRNKKRDMNVSKELKSMGWKVIRIWEHVINYSNSG